jgi:hypothetical protein
LPKKLNKLEKTKDLKESWNISYCNTFFFLWMNICLTEYYYHYATFIILASEYFLSKKIQIFKIMNVTFCMSSNTSVLMWCIASFDFYFLWCMIHKLIPDAMYVVYSKFDVSGVTYMMDGLQNKVRKWENIFTITPNFKSYLL